MYNKSEFRFSETFNNSDGKTSGSGFIGVLLGILTGIAFLITIAGWWVGKPDILEIFDKVLQLGLLSSALLGVRKLSGVFGKDKTEIGAEGEGKNVDKQPG